MTLLSKWNMRAALFYIVICIGSWYQEITPCNSFCQELELDALQITEFLHKRPKKNWTIIIYMAADNDLRGFAARNIKQMTSVGSSEEVTILVELHIRLAADKKITRRYYIEPGKIVHINADDQSSQKMDSGDQQTLISCCSWAMNNYPADNYALILWNHGTGIIDPRPGKMVHASELFSFNPISNKLELDRNVDFLDFINQQPSCQRGICWDDTTGNYLTNQKLVNALDYVCNTYNNGKKFAIIGFDACLMAMAEVADLIKKYTHIMIGSQEVELGTGWNYQLALSQFNQELPTPDELAKHIVAMYEKTYNKVTTDYTLSAINLSNIESLNNNIHAIAQLLVHGLKDQDKTAFKNSVKASRDKNNCTHFDEPSYVDLHHLYTNLITNIAKLKPTHDNQFIQQLSNLLEQGKKIIEEVVIANVTSINLPRARGLSIYFPEHKLHFSYEKTPFACQNAWLQFICSYLFA